MNDHRDYGDEIPDSQPETRYPETRYPERPYRPTDVARCQHKFRPHWSARIARCIHCGTERVLA